MNGGAAQRAVADAFAARLAPDLAEMRERKLSLHQMAAELTANGKDTPRGGKWTATSVRNVLARSVQLMLGNRRRDDAGQVEPAHY